MRLLPVAAAVALLLPLSDVHALALGRVSVQSALGEPLRAEVEVTQITPEEAASLRAAPAAPEAFRAAGIERHPAINELRITPERRTDGRFVLRLSSDRVINEPVIDLLLETSWGAGRIVRDYTLLFDPPAGRETTPAAPPAPVAAAQLPPLPTTAGLAPGESPVAAPAAPAAPAAANAASAPAAPATPAPAAAAVPAARVTVRAGDTAGKLVAAAKPASVSLEQMLVALLRANPDAFVANNMNRLKAGAVLEMPATEAAAAVEAREARRTVIAQSQDFNEFRRRLAERTGQQPAAEAAPPANAPAAGRQATGKVEARVEEKTKRPADTAPDRLTLSKGAVQGQPAAAAGKASAASAAKAGSEERIASQRARQDAGQRQAELERNIAELSRLSAGVSGAGAAPGAATASAASAAARTASAGLALGQPAKPASASASAAARAASGASAAAASASPASAAASAAESPASAAAATASEPASAPAEAASAAAPASAPASGAQEGQPDPVDRAIAFVADLGNNPWPLAIGSAIVAGLAAMGGLLWSQRRKPGQGAKAKPAQAGSSSRNSLRRPSAEEVALGGGLAVPRPSGPAAGLAGLAGATGALGAASALGPEAGGEADPLAEAQVYLSYGRDLQAEELLQQVLRETPYRMPAIVLLLEVFARRFDWEAFEPLAKRAQALTGGQGPDWARVVELGRGLAPVGHPLFSGEAPLAEAAPAAAAAAPEADAAPPAWYRDAAAAAAPSAAAPATAATAPGSAPTPEGLDLDLAGFRMQPPPAASSASAQAEPEYDPEIDGLFEGDVGAGRSTAAPGTAQAPAGAPLEFDLAGLSLDLGEAPASAAAGSDPLSTKLALAEEFRSIGDTEGARALLEEVRAQASGELRERAERLLAELA